VVAHSRRTCFTKALVARPGPFVFPLVLAATAAAQQLIPPCDLLKSSRLAEAARESYAARKYEIAAQQFREAYDACPSQRELLLGLAQALTYERNFDEAILAAQDRSGVELAGAIRRARFFLP